MVLASASSLASAAWASASLTIFLISSSLRPLDAVIFIDCSLPFSKAVAPTTFVSYQMSPRFAEYLGGGGVPRSSTTTFCRRLPSLSPCKHMDCDWLSDLWLKKTAQLLRWNGCVSFNQFGKNRRVSQCQGRVGVTSTHPLPHPERPGCSRQRQYHGSLLGLTLIGFFSKSCLTLLLQGMRVTADENYLTSGTKSASARACRHGCLPFRSDLGQLFQFLVLTFRCLVPRGTFGRDERQINIRLHQESSTSLPFRLLAS